MRRGLNLGGLAHGLVRLPATLRVDEVRRKDGVDERRLSETSLAWRHVDAGEQGRVNANGVVIGDAPTTMTLNWKPRFKSLCSICWVIVSKPT